METETHARMQAHTDMMTTFARPPSLEKNPLLFAQYSLFVFVIRLFVNNIDIRIRIRICENREYSCIRVFAAAPSFYIHQFRYWLEEI